MSSVHTIPNLHKESNIYYHANSDMFNLLVGLIENNWQSFSQKLKLKTPENLYKYKHLVKWIDDNLPLLSNGTFKYSYTTKCYWIIYGLTDFPICPVCKKQDNYKNKNICFGNGYAKSCSRACSRINPERCAKISATHKRNEKENPNYWNDRYEKSKKTCLKNYNVENPSQSNEIKQKKSDTVFLHFGVRHNFQVPEVRKEIEQTWLENYGVKHISQSDYYKQAFTETSLKKFGVSHPMQYDKIRKKCHKKYVYNNIIFDSSWELALYIYLVDNNIQFEYQPIKPQLFYTYDHKQHRYYPDFKIGNQLIEIKGDQLIDSDGKWIAAPYFKHIATDDEYHKMCSLSEAKHQCAIANNVKILTFEDCKKYITYINAKYGKTYLSKFKIKSHRD